MTHSWIPSEPASAVARCSRLIASPAPGTAAARAGDLPINHAEIEYEVAGGASGSVCVHLPCYLVWRQEAKALRLSEGERHPRRTADELLARLRGSKTDLSRFVEAMRWNQQPHIVVSTNAVRAWQEREPQTWAMVCDWLAEQGKSVVQV